MKPLSIVIITLNEEKRIGKLLEDLSKQTVQNFEVILVDSNSEDSTIQVAQSFSQVLPSLTIEKMSTRGVSLGRNTGAQLAQYAQLLFLDADVRLQPHFLENSLNEMDEHQLMVAGAYMASEGLSLKHRLGYKVFNLGLKMTQYFFPTAVGACIFSHRDVHSLIGGFDESIHLCEDCNYVLKASKSHKFRMLDQYVFFDPRRLEQDGTFSTGFTYLKANIRRFFIGEMRNNEIEYKFGHYS